MSSFQFPANPSDGDIVVRGNLQAFYNAATNTWRVSEVPTAPGIPGPPGPPGPEGPPGQGAEVSGVVNTFADLPEPNTQQFKYWVVKDTNTLYISDGLQWVALGGPIQGPPGDPGEDGNDGSNGQNGRGWYDTNIIDERPTNYQVQFLSNDGLGFTTDNIMGPQGETGTLQVATADTLGGIKIGRGLTILPDGTAQAGQTYVSLETVPLDSDGLPVPVPYDYKFALEFETQFDSWGDNINGSQDGSSGSARGWQVSHESTFVMPTLADGAVVYYFSSSGVTPYASPGQLVPGWMTGETKLEVEGAVFEDGGKLNVPHTHNFSTISSQVGQSSSTPSIKIGLIRFEKASTVKFTASARVTTARKASYGIGRGRIAIVPFKSASGDANANNPFGMQELLSSFSRSVGDGTDFDGLDDVTDEENIKSEATDLKLQITQLKQEIDSLIVQEYPQGTTGYTELMGYRQELIDLRNLPGTAEEIAAEVLRIDTEVSNLAEYQFRFE